MLPLAFLFLWAGYGVGSWGYICVRGWNIPARAWFSPLHPYQWPATGDPQPVPKGTVFPTSKAPKAAAAAASRQGNPTGAGAPPTTA